MAPNQPVGNWPQLLLFAEAEPFFSGSSPTGTGEILDGQGENLGWLDR